MTEMPAFHTELVALMPQLRRMALAMTRNRAEADDLVQDSVVNALKAQDSFLAGTNLAAWMYRIMRNRFLSLKRQARPGQPLDDAGEQALCREGGQEWSATNRELGKAMDRLPREQREALLLIALEGVSYEEAAAMLDCSVGTAKSRVHRARRTLQAHLLGEDEPRAALAPSAPRRSAERSRPAAAVCGIGGLML